MAGPAPAAILKTVRRSLAIGFALLGLAACGRESVAPKYATNDCRRVALLDSSTGAQVVGAEDMAFDAASRLLIVSAYDRRAVEKASRGVASPPQGGLYEVAIDDVFGGENTINVSSILDRASVPNGLRPHGIAFANGEIAFINRGYVIDGTQWRMQPALLRIDGAGAVTSTRAHCAANDIALVGDSVLTSRDHAACGGFSRLLENVLGQKRSGAFFDDGAALIDGVAFANGVSVIEGGFAVAATRENTVHLFRANAENGSREFAARTPGAPDNLSVSSDGDIVAAVHPNLLRLALNRSWGLGKAGSRIVLIDVETGDSTLLFDDPKGALYSAATVGIETSAGLVAGSVTDAGLLVCERAR